MVDIEKRKVEIDRLRWKCDPGIFTFKTTKDIEPSDEIIGQDRAIVALKTGIEIESPGYNIFVSGLTGANRIDLIKKTMEKFVKPGDPPDDICYVYNFKDNDKPVALTLPAGLGGKFKKAMADLIAKLKEYIPQATQSREFKNNLKNIAEKYGNQQKELVNRLKLKSQEEGFSMVQVQMGAVTRPLLVPTLQDEPTSLEKLDSMVEAGEFPKERFDALKDKSFALNTELDAVRRESVELEKKMMEEIKKLEADTIKPEIENQIESLRAEFKFEKISLYLDDVKADIIENTSYFKTEEAPETPQMPFPFIGLGSERSPLWRYEVNLLVDNSDVKERPVILETSPTYANLFGNIERTIDRAGAVQTDFTKLKPGSIHRANGGYLIMNAFDLLTEPGSWHCLKRTLKNKKIEFHCIEPMFLFASLTIKPEPVEADLKVIMVGDPYIYQLLMIRDDEFPEIFKIKSDFDPVMIKNEENVRSYASFIKKTTEEEGLLPFDRSGVSGIVEYGVREGRSQKKMSSRFSEVADIIREASYWAKSEGKEVVGEEHVKRSIAEKIKRVNMSEDKIKEKMREGVLMIETEGSVVGQVNGLAVYSLGDHSFGAPSKITAVTSLGRGGIINIEREAKLSGNIYDKGVLILTGYLRGKYAQDIPLSLSASLTFEQSYYGVDGDSASSTEVYAIVSALTEIPLRQDIAVTGSVNQKGRVQPIGGVNEKIEGFFDVCADRGLTGSQGVMIPDTNVDDLMLRSDVIDAVREGKFNIYNVSTIDEGIEILTGMEAGEMSKEGGYPEGTINYLVIEKLTGIHEKLKKLGKTDKKDNDDKGEGNGENEG
ncbi:MAG: AAA family ATPase [Deltaproteobacteria bacterium]|uniref:endopeptidase La n=1 Tax=Candidatus Zymogenus saltonus TaxID=2844893 RepID=A0A9D8KIP1_9DELT|nr:AAA family ATPase [Candidatus Zymogenus saltonus]